MNGGADRKVAIADDCTELPHIIGAEVHITLFPTPTITSSFVPNLP